MTNAGAWMSRSAASSNRWNASIRA
jgi:hypothetical protein